jgi:glutathione gamma-glutamylcysteinyltransferase
MTTTLYRRPLPDDLIAFSDPLGKRVFREALEAGTMEGWYALAEQFHTQADPAFCGLGSLVVVLNALGVDPRRLWKGPWRWFSEELLDCCVALEEVRARGVTLVELACLARCNGASAVARHASDAGLEALRHDLAQAARGDGSVVIASYSRRELGQSGGGHFSPLGGLHAERDLGLVLDVARFKYPPHWVALERLHRAMLAVDPDTQRSRGWIVLARREQPGGLMLSLSCRGARWRDVVALFDAPLQRWRREPPASVERVMATFADEIGALAPHLEWREPVDERHAATVMRMRQALEASPVGRAIAAHAGERAGLAAALFYTLAPERLSLLPEGVREGALALASLDALDAELAGELRTLREQLATLRSQASD